MNIPQLGTLTDIPLREAWPLEAQSFTPWLCENLAGLSGVIGIPLDERLAVYTAALQNIEVELAIQSGEKQHNN